MTFLESLTDKSIFPFVVVGLVGLTAACVFLFIYLLCTATLWALIPFTIGVSAIAALPVLFATADN